MFYGSLNKSVPKEIAMDLCKGITFTRFYFIFVFLFTFACCIHAESAPSNNPVQPQIIQEIMEKVSNLTSGALSKAPHETKETILKKIENKLRKSADMIGPDADKYISFIITQFKAKMNNSFTVNETENIKHDIEVKEESAIRRNKEEDKKARTTIDSETRKEIIKDIANKIQTLAKGFLKNAKTIENKQQILEKIKKKIMDSTKQKHIQLHNTHAELKVYSSLIAQGIEASMRRMLESEADGRRINSQVLQKPVSAEIIINKDHKAKKEKKEKEYILKKTKVLMDLEEIAKYRELISQSLNGTAVDPRHDHCGEMAEDTCLSIQKINQIPCDKGKVIPVQSLCNNVFDCLNGVDEKNCSAQAMEQVRIATKVMSKVEATLNRKCFALSEVNFLMTQNQVLRAVLQTQMDFLKTHVERPLQGVEGQNEILDEDFVKETVNDVTKIISTLSYALDGALCASISDPEHQGNNGFRKSNDNEVNGLDEMEDIDAPPKEAGWSPKSCVCAGQFCRDPPTCPAACKRVCWQRYSLNHWGCQALNGATAVSLNVVCDGKLDCFDETDEAFCVAGIFNVTTTKFEAAKSYSNLLDLLVTKSKSNELLTSQNKLLALHELVRKLQKLTIRTNINMHAIKSLRTEAFNLIVAIYDDLKETVNLAELDDHYLILLTINEKLVTALKISHMGNENLIPTDGCYCRGGLCALRRCTKHCIQACLAEPWLTKFACNDVRNHTIPIESICNGIKNCPKEEDEQNCSKEVCRGHHLVMLRHNLKNVGVKHRGSVMGEVIESWKAKVSAALIVAETGPRTTHKVLVEIVHRLLHDLVLAFAAMEDYRRSNSEYALQEFKGISKIVMQTLKSCTN